VSQTQAIDGIQTTGAVIDHRVRRVGSFNGSLFPVVKFETQHARPVEFESGPGSNIRPEVTVVYDPSRPGQASVTVGSTLWSRPRMFVVAGVLALISSSSPHPFPRIPRARKREPVKPAPFRPL
jgi:hypothetical protein